MKVILIQINVETGEKYTYTQPVNIENLDNTIKSFIDFDKANGLNNVYTIEKYGN